MTVLVVRGLGKYMRTEDVEPQSLRINNGDEGRDRELLEGFGISKLRLTEAYQPRTINEAPAVLLRVLSIMFKP